MFMEYARNAVRMSAFNGYSKYFCVYPRLHWPGEDGPTHQPIEQVANLRMTPNLA